MISREWGATLSWCPSMTDPNAKSVDIAQVYETRQYLLDGPRHSIRLVLLEEGMAAAKKEADVISRVILGQLDQIITDNWDLYRHTQQVLLSGEEDFVYYLARSLQHSNLHVSAVYAMPSNPQHTRL